MLNEWSVMAGDRVHPDLRMWSRVLPRQGFSGYRGVRVLRALHSVTALYRPDGVQIVSLGSGVRLRVYRPSVTATTAPALLWIHGGGYVLGRAQQDDALCARLARKLGAIVTSVDYRLAPEHPYPASLDDCHRALTWLAQQPDVDNRRIAIGGASAGGGLAAMLALRARDVGPVQPVFQLLTYPMLDDRSSERTDVAERDFRLWSTRANRYGWQSYLGDADPAVAVPARRSDLAGAPPAWIGVGTLDLFHDEDLAYADRLREAGVPCAVTIVPGVFHGFDLVAPGTSVARSFFATQCEALRTAFAAAL